MSRRGNCWDNAVAESFFSSLKSEQIKKRIYNTRDEARSEVFDYIEGFYNGATSISINSAPTSSSGSVKLRYEICLVNWGNANETVCSQGFTTGSLIEVAPSAIALAFASATFSVTNATSIPGG